MIKTLLIKPDLTTEESLDEYSYQCFFDIRDKEINEKEGIDIKLPDGSWLHTITTEEGMFITIHKEI